MREERETRKVDDRGADIIVRSRYNNQVWMYELDVEYMHKEMEGYWKVE